MRWEKVKVWHGVESGRRITIYLVGFKLIYTFYSLQIVRKERPLYIQTANCVEEKDWVDLLSKICDNNLRRLELIHPCAFISGEWTW